MERTTFEGFWEDVASHGAELAGRRVRLIVLDDPGALTTLDHALAGLLAKAEDLCRGLEERPESDPVWAEGVLEKFRGQGFDL